MLNQQYELNVSLNWEKNINTFIIDTLMFLSTFSKQVHYGRKIQNYAGYYCNDMHPNSQALLH